ncbi:MAG: GcvT family protein [Nocardioides sp.]
MSEETVAEIPARARVVIIGGGVIGASTAYHLAALGGGDWADVVLLEQGRLSCGTTWHAAGLVGPLRASEAGTRLVRYSAELYASLESETGLATGYQQVGGVVVARTPDRMTMLARTAANAVAYGLPCELLTPAQARELWPLMRVDDLLGAIWLPGDGKVNPADLTQALAKGARMRGVKIHERVRVLDVRTAPAGGARSGRRRVTGVRTDRGDIEAEVVVNCAGQWAKALGDAVGVPIPLHSAEHFYVVTDAIEGVGPGLPILRDPDGYTYFKEEVGGLVVGGFEPVAKPWVAPDQIPYPFEFSLLEEDWEHFSVLMESAVERIPALSETGIRKFYNGPESFTPDNQFLLGQAPGLDGYFVGAGFNSVGIASAGGAGRALAEWIVAGEPDGDLLGTDVRRFAPFNGNNRWLRDRVAEVLGMHYEIAWPNREPSTARPFRTSPLHDRLAAAGACFGSRMGWERPNFFAQSMAPSKARSMTQSGVGPGVGGGATPRYTWGKPDWLPWSAAEQRACRHAVAVFDQTSFSKFTVTGPDAATALQWICAADIDVPPGRCVYTPWLNRHGRYESDLTVTRVAENEFLVISSSASMVRDRDWFELNLSSDWRVRIDDVSTQHAVIGVMGPRAGELLSRLTSASLSEADFGFATSRLLDLGHARIRATRMTYVGETGWELLVPTEFAAGVYDAVMAAGAGLGISDAGYYAMESLRLEKGYRAFGRELTPAYSPVAAGLLFATAANSAKNFLGRDALLAERERMALPGPRRRLVSFVVDDPDPMLWGGELIRLGGAPVGQITSAAWGETVGSCVGLAYLRHDDRITPEWLAQGGFSVDAPRYRAGGQVPERPQSFPLTPTLRAPL